MNKLLDGDRAESLYKHLAETICKDADPKSTILSIRQIHEQIFKYFCENSSQTLSGLMARLTYAKENLQLSPAQYTQSNILRLICNKIVHEADALISPSELDSAYFVVTNLIEQNSDIKPPDEITSFLKQQNAKPFPPLPKTKKASFQGVVLKHSLEQSGTALSLEVVNEDGDECSVLLRNDSPEFPGRQWTELGKTLWKYASISLSMLSVVTGRENHFMSNPQTQVVVEPDFLIDISVLAECFDHKSFHPEFFILSRMITEASNDKTLGGKAVNSILDELILDPEKDFKDSFSRFITDNPFSMIAEGYSKVLEMYHKIEGVHLKNLQDFAQSVQGDEVLLEASFIAPSCGLQGRLDVLQKNRDKYSIVELKSGRPPADGLWKQNHMQVIGYNMMINQCYGRQNCVSSSIFYSQDSKKPHRAVVSIAKLEQELMHCRNRVMGILYILATDPRKFFDWLKMSNPNYQNQILDRKLDQIRSALLSLEAYEYEWLLEMVKSIIIEIWHAKIGSTGTRDASVYGFNALWRQSSKAKIDNYELITDLRINSVTHNCVNLALEGDKTITNFRSGDIVVFYQKDRAVDKQELIRGKIIAIDADSLSIQIRGGAKNNSRLSQDKLWSIEHDMYESSLYTPLASVFNFVSNEDFRHRRPIFLGIQAPGFKEDKASTEDYIEGIINRIEAAEDYFIVQGPPGTGKTSGLLCKYLKKQQDTGKTILVLSFTNRAIDEICLNLDRQQVPYIRTGASATIAEMLLSNRIAGKKFRQIEQVLTDNKIWISTVQSCNAWYPDFLKMHKVDELIIDEASQIIEASILGLISHVPKVVLIGDQNQLPPIVVQPDRVYSFSDPRLQGLQYTSYNQSLLERLFALSKHNSWDSARFMLFKHYRMHSEIAGLISHYYDDKLQAICDPQFALLVQDSAPEQPALLSKRIVWIDTAASVHAHYDLAQVELLPKIIKQLIDSSELEDLERDIGIISPFRAMNMAILKSLPSEWQAITVDTVERYQGSERKIMIICLPLQNRGDIRSIESLNYDGRIDRKLNVALSRAKQRVLIIGNRQICSHSPHYRNLIDKITQTGIIIPEKEI